MRYCLSCISDLLEETVLYSQCASQFKILKYQNQNSLIISLQNNVRFYRLGKSLSSKKKAEGDLKPVPSIISLIVIYFIFIVATETFDLMVNKK